MLGDDIYHLIQRGDYEDDLNRVLAVGFPVDKPDYTGWTALHYAAHMGRTGCLSTLLECGADVNALTSREGQTALFLAARGGHLPCVQLLHAYHRWAVAEATTQLGRATAVEDAEQLLPAAAGLDTSGTAEEEFGRWTPLHVAVHCDQVSCAHYLVAHSLVDINARDYYDRTALQLLIEKRLNPALTVWMVLRGARVLSKPSAPPMWDWTKLDLDHMVDTFDPTVKQPQHDACFVVEGKRLYAERAVLCARSTFFAGMFGSSMKEAVEGEVELESTYNAVFAMLEWMYTGCISTDNFDDILQLWQSSHMYDMEALQNYCQKRLLKLFEARSKQLGDHSAQEMWNYALALFKATEGGSSFDSALKAISGIYLLGHLEAVLQSYRGDPIAFVGRLFAAVDRKTYDPAAYPTLLEIEAEIAFFRRYKRLPKGQREIIDVQEMEERKKGKCLLWFEEATSEGVEGWGETLAQLRMLRQLEEDCLFFDGLKPHRCFDLIAGTGMGGVAAICLGRAQMAVPAVEALVCELVAAAGDLGKGGSWLSYVGGMMDWGGETARAHLAHSVREIVERHLAASHQSQQSLSLVGLTDDHDHLRLCEIQDRGEETHPKDDRVKVLVMAKRAGASKDVSRADNRRGLFLKLYGDRVAARSGSSESGVNLADVIVAALAAASPGLLNPVKLANVVVGRGGAQGASSGLGGRGRDTLLAEMQKLWPRWELKLLLSLGSDQAPASAQSPSSLPSLLPWAWSVLADHMSSFAGYLSRDRGKNVWDKAHERCLDRANADNGGGSVGDKVATVLAVEGWRPLRSGDYYDDDKAASATRRSRPTKDLLRQSIAAFVRMSEESDCDDQIDDDNHDAARRTKRWNLLHLHPSSTTGDTTSRQSDKEVLRALADRVKQSMRQMELVAANDDQDEGEDEGGEFGEDHEPTTGEESDRPPPSGRGRGEEESWVLM